MEPTQVTSLDELGGGWVDVPLKRPDGRTLVIKLRELSEDDLWRIRRANKWPEAPIVEMTKTGPVRNYSDPAYQASVEDTNRRFAQRMLLASLPFDVPGDDEDARLAALQARVGQYVYAQLVEATQRINLISAEEIAQVAGSFRRAGFGGAPGDAGAGPGAQPVAGAAAA